MLSGTFRREYFSRTALWHALPNALGEYNDIQISFEKVCDGMQEVDYCGSCGSRGLKRNWSVKLSPCGGVGDDTLEDPG